MKKNAISDKFLTLKNYFSAFLIGVLVLAFLDLTGSGGMLYSYTLKRMGVPDWVALYSLIGLVIAYVLGEVYVAVWGNKASMNETEPPVKDQD